MADTLARIHALPLPPASAPIPRQGNPFLETLEGIELNAMRFLDKAVPDPDARAEIAEELRRCAAWRRRSAKRRSRSPSRWPTPIPATSSSIARGIAWFVDLEKVHVGSPAIDLAHATLPTSTLWHPDVGKRADARGGAGLLRRLSRAHRCGEGGGAAAVAGADAPADLAAHDLVHGALAGRDAQPARSVEPVAMERRRTRSAR